MNLALTLSPAASTTAGVLLLTIVAVEWGGTFMLKIVRGRAPMTTFQHSFARAGHAHAGVLVTLALVCQILADGAGLGPAAAPVGETVRILDGSGSVIAEAPILQGAG